MTKKIEAGRELDAEVAERVMGLRTRPRSWSKEGPCLQEAPGKPWRIIPHYSTSVADAWEVVEKIRSASKLSVIVEASTNPTEYICAVGAHHRGQWIETVRAVSESAPAAICAAALRLNDKGEK